jgi:hypothetical protein
VKLLLFGSLLVLMSVVTWAAADFAVDRLGAAADRPFDAEPVIRFVDAATTPKAVVWQTSTGASDCAYVRHRRDRDERMEIAALVGSADATGIHEEEDPCAGFRLGELERGAKVEVVGECGKLAKIRVLFGPLAGRQGCIEAAELAAAGD